MVKQAGTAWDSWFSHATFEAPGEDCSNEWLELVDDGQYGALSRYIHPCISHFVRPGPGSFSLT